MAQVELVEIHIPTTSKDKHVSYLDVVSEPAMRSMRASAMEISVYLFIFAGLELAESRQPFDDSSERLYRFAADVEHGSFRAMWYHYEGKTPVIIENLPRSFRIWMAGISTIGHDVFWPIANIKTRNEPPSNTKQLDPSQTPIVAGRRTLRSKRLNELCKVAAKTKPKKNEKRNRNRKRMGPVQREKGGQSANERCERIEMFPWFAQCRYYPLKRILGAGRHRSIPSPAKSWTFRVMRSSPERVVLVEVTDKRMGMPGQWLEK
ncbi:hypothetical protein ARMSODRAFT_976176 [Armillaria solidipes]|uniref:Uncharacterized protein n=1 Tax=Armillaria solidipes TaxID=1076256 RepID=A0A2H3BFC1_9AGAR|nr:hypothetical protein ARMSODRAFT_976176 [Armillaria solidipes]